MTHPIRPGGMPLFQAPLVSTPAGARSEQEREVGLGFPALRTSLLAPTVDLTAGLAIPNSTGA
ncbi:MAG: hypothetical protein AAFQ82_24865, partial [Myxococcota bacterium]